MRELLYAEEFTQVLIKNSDKNTKREVLFAFTRRKKRAIFPISAGSAEIEVYRVLPRIGSALAQFIAPITSSGAQGQKSVGKKSKSNLETKYEGKDRSTETPTKQEAQHAPTAIQERGAAAKDQGGGRQGADSQGDMDQQQESLVPGKSNINLEAKSSQSLAGSFLQLFSLFQLRSDALLRWLGKGVYDEAAHVQKKNIKFKKGIMVDEKVQ